MSRVLNRLDALKEELDGIKETEGEAEKITAHVAALEEILRRSQKPVRFLALLMGYDGSDDIAESVILDCQDG